MGFQKVQAAKKYLGGYEDKVTKELKFKEGEILVTGVYMGTLTNKYNPSKPSYEFETDKGERVVLNSAGHLAYQMDDFVKIGDYVRVTYAGTQTMERGTFKDSRCHQFAVEIDPDKSVSVEKKVVEEEDTKEPSETTHKDFSVEDLVDELGAE